MNGIEFMQNLFSKENIERIKNNEMKSCDNCKYQSESFKPCGQSTIYRFNDCPKWEKK